MVFGASSASLPDDGRVVKRILPAIVLQCCFREFRIGPDGFCPSGASNEVRGEYIVLRESRKLHCKTSTTETRRFATFLADGRRHKSGGIGAHGIMRVCGNGIGSGGASGEHDVLGRGYHEGEATRSCSKLWPGRGYETFNTPCGRPPSGGAMSPVQDGDQERHVQDYGNIVSHTETRWRRLIRR